MEIGPLSSALPQLLPPKVQPSKTGKESTGTHLLPAPTDNSHTHALPWESHFCAKEESGFRFKWLLRTPKLQGTGIQTMESWEIETKPDSPGAVASSLSPSSLHWLLEQQLCLSPLGSWLVGMVDTLWSRGQLCCGRHGDTSLWTGRIVCRINQPQPSFIYTFSLWPQGASTCPPFPQAGIPVD